MRINNKAQVVFVGFMIAIVIFVLAMAFLFPLKESKDNARTDINCTTSAGVANTTISDYDTATCHIVDVQLPYVFLGLLGLAGAVIAARLIWA